MVPLRWLVLILIIGVTVSACGDRSSARPLTAQEVERDLQTPADLQRQLNLVRPDGVLVGWSYVAPPSPYPLAGITVYESVVKARQAAANDRSGKVVNGAFCGSCKVFRARNVELVLSGVGPHPTGRQTRELETELQALGSGS
jgi:hypothetical protein